MREAHLVDLTHYKERMVGLEFENPLTKIDGTIIDKKDIKNFWKSFVKKGDLKDIDYLTKVLVGAKKRLKNGSFEILNTDAGICILEMSLSPQKNLHDAKKVFDEVLGYVLKTTKKLDLRLLGYAVQPRRVTGYSYDYKSEKSLYRAFSKSIRNNLMIPVCAHQTGVSVRIQELIRATNMLQALSGAIVCLIANSPVFEDKVTPWKELRLFAWELMSTSGRTTQLMQSMARTPSMPYKSLSDYLKHIWKAQILLPPLRNGQWVKPVKNMTWIEFFKKDKCPAQDLFNKKFILEPIVSDINLAAISFWPDAKPHITLNPERATVKDFVIALEQDKLEEYLDDKLLNCYLEYRIGCTAPVGEELALPALTLGLVNNLEEAEELVGKYKWKDWSGLRQISYIAAMDTMFKGESILPLLTRIVNIAEKGLKKRKFSEEIYLKPLFKRITECNSPADKAIHIFETKGMGEFIKSVSYK